MAYNRARRLSRRTLLRGAGGVAVALPLLDAMVPAHARAQTIARLQPKRLGFIYFPNGYIKERWTPPAEGVNYQLTNALEPLAAFKDKFNVLTGLADDPAKTRAGFHDRAIASLWTGVEMVLNKNPVGQSVDQIAAPVLGKEVPFSSLEIGVEQGGGSYRGPSFKSAKNRLPYETNPRYLFERMFGDADRLDPAAIAQMRDRQRSMLDVIKSDAATLSASLGAGDRVKMQEYLESIRDIERRLAVLDKLADKKVQLERPAGPADYYPDAVQLAFDLQATALQADMTRVWTFMMGTEGTDMTYPAINWNKGHHITSHHGYQPDLMEGLAKINRYQIQLFSYLLTKLDAIKEPEGSVLDNTLLTYSSSLGDSHRHMQVDLPVLLFGGKAMGIRGGRHLKFPDDTPITNLYVTMLGKADVPIEKIGDSTGELRVLSEA